MIAYNSWWFHTQHELLCVFHGDRREGSKLKTALKKTHLPKVGFSFSAAPSYRYLPPLRQYTTIRHRETRSRADLRAAQPPRLIHGPESPKFCYPQKLSTGRAATPSCTTIARRGATAYAAASNHGSIAALISSTSASSMVSSTMPSTGGNPAYSTQPVTLNASTISAVATASLSTAHSQM